MKKISIYFMTAIVFIALISTIANAQTTDFTFQGSLKDGASPANANYDFEFALFDALSAGSQVGSTIPRNNVPVANGIFSVKLDFGSVFPGADRYLEIRVRLAGQPGITTLAPRQLMNSAPYSVKSLNTDNAANATTAGNALQLGGVAASQYVVTTDPRMTDARPPTAGSSDYIQNQNAATQASSNFNISGNGTIGGTLTGNIVNTSTQYNIGGSRVLGISGTSSLPDSNFFAGIGAGTNNAPNGLSGAANSFVGAKAGQANTTGFSNSFFGTFAGISNTTGGSNTFLGVEAGELNTTGGGNSFMGQDAGFNNSSGNNNSFLGVQAGFGNTTGSNNVMIGRVAGTANVTGGNLTIIGFNTNVASNNLTFATAIGSGSVVSSNNTVVLGRGADTVQIPGNLAVSGTLTATLPTGSANYIQNQNAAPQASSNFNISGNGAAGGTLTGNIVSATTQYNIAGNRILSNTGSNNLFAGANAGAVNTATDNAFFGALAGDANTTGSSNSFFGSKAGTDNTTGLNNSFFGRNAGFFNTTGSSNAFFGINAGISNTTASGNTFVGAGAGDGNTAGGENAFFGRSAGFNNTIGVGNTIIGGFAEVGSNNLTNAAAIGHRAQVDANNSLVLGSINGINGATEDTNVGIGTTAPTKLLTIGEPETTTATASVGVFSTTGTNIVVRETTNNVENIFGASSSNGGIYGTTSNDPVTIRTNNINRMRILNTGEVVLFNLGAAGGTSLCLNGSSQISNCSSSLRYKTNIGQFESGLDFVKQLRPISFNWKDGGTRDVGFSAEDVAKIDPRFVTYNDKGEVEGVKYDRLSVAFVNAFKEQQAQIESQQKQNQSQQTQIEQQRKQIESLTKTVCAINPKADICRP